MIRTIPEESFRDWVVFFQDAMMESWSSSTDAHWRATMDPDRILGAYDGDRLVASAATGAVELTVPGGARVAANAVTAVGSSPVHRGRGHVRALMAELDDLAIARGEAASVLWASETVIYERFGYGPAMVSRAMTIARAHAGLRDEAAALVRELGGAFDLLDAEASVSVCRELFAAHGMRRPGEISRRDGIWAMWGLDAAEDRDGWSGRRVLVHHDDAGVADGYLAYRWKDEWRHALPHDRLKVLDLVGAPVVRAALWQQVMTMHLIDEVTVHNVSLDDPIIAMLRDPRRLRTDLLADGLWLRPLDPAALLGARATRASGAVTIAVDDPMGLVDATLRVEGADGSLHTEPATEDASTIRLSASAFGAVVLGGTSVRQLATAGRIAGPRADVELLHDLLAWHEQPGCSTSF